MNQERITHAAVKSEAGLILFGKSHADCFHQGHYTGIGMSQRAKDQGFMTSAGRYVERDEACKIAHEAGQIDDLRGGHLFSEDLWSRNSGGKYSYDSITGYYK